MRVEAISWAALALSAAVFPPTDPAISFATKAATAGIETPL